MKNVEQVILYAHDEDLMLIGEVTGFGSPYNPRTWDEGSFYQCPKPWSKEPAKYWIALDNLRPLEGFNPDLYELAAGKDKGKTGKVMSVNAKNHTALVEGVNMVTKHAKPSAANQQGGILHQEAPIDISNIAYVVKGDKTSKIGYDFKDGKKVRVAKATGEVID